MEERRAARRSTTPAAAPRSLAAIDTLAVVTNVFHDYGDTAALLAERLGCQPARTHRHDVGRQHAAVAREPPLRRDRGRPQRARARRRRRGLADDRARSARRACTPSWTPHRDTACRAGATGGRHERARVAPRRCARPTSRSRCSRTRSAPRAACRSTRIAPSSARSPSAARGDRGRESVRVVPRRRRRPRRSPPSTPTNRMVAFPYPKYMNAIIDVNQGAALLLASEAAARRLGIAARALGLPVGRRRRDRAVVPAGPRRLSTRCPGTRRAAARAASRRSAAASTTIAHLDLYSCFPIAPRLSAATLGLDPADDRARSP